MRSKAGVGRLAGRGRGRSSCPCRGLRLERTAGEEEEMVEWPSRDASVERCHRGDVPRASMWCDRSVRYLSGRMHGPLDHPLTSLTDLLYMATMERPLGHMSRAPFLADSLVDREPSHRRARLPNQTQRNAMALLYSGSAGSHDAWDDGISHRPSQPETGLVGQKQNCFPLVSPDAQIFSPCAYSQAHECVTLHPSRRCLLYTSSTALHVLVHPNLVPDSAVSGGSSWP